jgi:hypothetical protein
MYTSNASTWEGKADLEFKASVGYTARSCQKGLMGWALTTVILATQEAEIRRIVVLKQPGKIVHETLF